MRVRRPDVRDEVVRHAGKLMAARGYEAVSVQEIADACGLSKQALLYHFKTKDAVKDAVIAHLLEHANAGLIGLMRTLAMDETDRLEQTLAQIDALFDAEPHAAAVILRFLLDRDEAAIAQISAGAEPWLMLATDVVRRGQKDGRIRKDLDPEAAVAQAGMLILTNFALLPLPGWNASTRRQWRARRLSELARAIRLILFGATHHSLP